MSILEIIHNKPLWTAFAAFMIAQFIKITAGIIKTRSIPWDRIFGTGGMPSSHSAGVCALATTVGLINGFDSSLFAISLTFASIIMYDATGIRWAAGKHAQTINMLVENLQDFFKEGFKPIKLKTLLGHTQPQVFLGALLGIATGLASYYFI